MQRLRLASNRLRVGLSFLILLGMTGGGFSNLFCPGGDGKQPCPMKAQLKRKQESKQKQGCCPDEAKKASEPDQEESDNCCCKIQPSETPQADLAKVSIPAVPIFLALAQPLSTVLVQASFEDADLISFYADGSPPTVFSRPDLGRAPPVA